MHVVADLGGLADHHAHAVVDEEAAADRRAGMDLDAGEEAAELRDEAAAQLPVAPPEPVRQAMENQGMQPGIAEYDLQPRSCGRIALEDRLDILAQSS